MIKAIFFDMGGVILDLTRNPGLNATNALAILMNIDINDSTNFWKENYYNLSTGKEKLSTFLERAKNCYNCKEETKQLMKRWAKIWEKQKEDINWELVEYIKKLKKKYKVYVLSDYFPTMSESEIDREINGIFEKYLVSYETGFRKSESGAFEYAERMTGFMGKECLLIDDTKKNIVAAKNAGWEGILYTNFPTFIQEMGKVLEV